MAELSGAGKITARRMIDVTIAQKRCKAVDRIDVREVTGSAGPISTKFSTLVLKT
jgi:hypothetical protein